MEFHYPELEKLTLSSGTEIITALSKLCGEDIRLSTAQLRRLEHALNSISLLDYDNFNEILLLAGQDRVSSHFFEYFFARHENKPRLRMKKGVIDYCGYAMLCYGNFRFAYKDLSQLPDDEFKEILSQYDVREGIKRIEQIRGRRPKTTDTGPIAREHTWFIGYLSAKLLEEDERVFYAISHRLGLADESEIERRIRSSLQGKIKDPTQLNDAVKKALKGVLQRSSAINASPWKDTAGDIKKRLEELRGHLKRSRDLATVNTDIYLSWAHMDIYFATSMRQRWEYESVYDFVKQVFAQPVLDGVPIRYFDPTQSFSHNRIDKGLVEGLMLNRAFLTVYLAQETDTLGKDSELASTLAQGKPVIAYVPRADEPYWQNLPSQPLDFFHKRALLLMADEAFKDETYIAEIKNRFGPAALDRLESHLNKLTDYISNRTFKLVGEEDDDFKAENEEMFRELYIMIGLCEGHYFDRRAYTLSQSHPLAVQVNLRNGVANGVLLVRDAPDCAELINDLLANQMKFSIIKREEVNELVEQRSKCPYRVATEDKTLENSFWNFYLTERKSNVEGGRKK